LCDAKTQDDNIQISISNSKADNTSIVIDMYRSECDAKIEEDKTEMPI